MQLIHPEFGKDTSGGRGMEGAQIAKGRIKIYNPHPGIIDVTPTRGPDLHKEVKKREVFKNSLTFA